MQGEPLDRDKLRDIRRARNKEKRKLKQQQKSQLIKPIKTINTVTIVSPEFLNKYNQPLAADTSGTINLVDIINKKPKQPKLVTLKKDEMPYIGNRLDSSQPVRVSGKHRDFYKKPKTSLKRKLIDLQQTNSASPIDYTEVISDDLVVLVEEFVSKVVELQEKLYKRNPIKGDIKRRYVSGLREVRKYLLANRIQFIVIAVDLKICQEDDPLHSMVKEIVKLSQSNNILYVFALKRRKLGKLMLKQVPISCMGVLNYDGANEIYNKINKEMQKLKQLEEKNNEIGTITKKIEILLK